MLRTLLVGLASLALALFVAAPPAQASTNGLCVFGQSGICVIANGECVGVGLGLQGVGVCQPPGGCAYVFVGFNQIPLCFTIGSTLP